MSCRSWGYQCHRSPQGFSSSFATLKALTCAMCNVPLDLEMLCVCGEMSFTVMAGDSGCTVISVPDKMVQLSWCVTGWYKQHLIPINAVTQAGRVSDPGSLP